MRSYKGFCHWPKPRIEPTVSALIRLACCLVSNSAFSTLLALCEDCFETGQAFFITDRNIVPRCFVQMTCPTLKPVRCINDLAFRNCRRIPSHDLPSVTCVLPAFQFWSALPLARLVMFAATCTQRGAKQGRVRMSGMTVAFVSVISVATGGRRATRAGLPGYYRAPAPQGIGEWLP